MSDRLATQRPFPRLAFYGDDFTGSTDALEVLAFAGLRCALFLEPPSPAMLAALPDLDAFGVAGDSRAMTPAEMDAHLPGVFQALAALRPSLIHYKVCSTFDSAPTIGNIGRAMEIARRTISDQPIPIVAATPALGRYCAFGTLFARSATDGLVYRIDRHPIMSVHPITPMDEGDLPTHLGRQTALAIAKLTLPVVDLGGEAIAAEWSKLASSGAEAILLDTTNATQLTEVGRFLNSMQGGNAPLFVVGGSGVEYGLTQWWNEHTAPPPVAAYDRFAGVDRVLAVSGSASSLSARQIAAALEAGFAEIAVDVRALVAGDGWRAVAADLAAQAVRLLREGRSVMLHTARGPDDSRIGAMIDALQARGMSREQARHGGGRDLGVRLGGIVREIMASENLPRLLLSGGDTSSQITKALAPDGLEIAARLAPGVPLCRTLSLDRRAAAFDIALKGGQVGSLDFFELARRGRA